MKPEEMNELLEVIKAYQPLVKGCIPLIVEVAHDVKPLIEGLVDASADLQLRFFNRLITPDSDEQAGKMMTREEAIQVLVSVTSGIVKRGMSK